MRAQRGSREKATAGDGAGMLKQGRFFSRWVELFLQARRESPHARVFAGEPQAERHYKGLLAAASTELFSQNFVEAFFRTASIDSPPPVDPVDNESAGDPPLIRDGVRLAAMALILGEDPYRWLRHASDGIPGWTDFVVEDCVRQALQYLLGWTRLQQTVRVYPDRYAAERISKTGQEPRVVWQRLVSEALTSSPLARELNAPGNPLSAFVPYLSVAAPDILTADAIGQFFLFPSSFGAGDFSPREARQAAAMAIVFGEDPYEWLAQICATQEEWTDGAISQLIRATYASMRPWMKAATESAPPVVSKAKAFGRMLAIERAVTRRGNEALPPGTARILVVTRGAFHEDPSWEPPMQYAEAWKTSRELTHCGVDYVFVALDGESGRAPIDRLAAVRRQAIKNAVNDDRFHYCGVPLDREGELNSWLGRHPSQLRDRLLVFDWRRVPDSIPWLSGRFEVYSSFRTPHPFGDHDTTAFRRLPENQAESVRAMVDGLIDHYTIRPFELDQLGP